MLTNIIIHKVTTMPDDFTFKRINLAKAYCDSLQGKGIANATSGLFLAGPRRVGKSTFLMEDLIPEAQSRNWLTIYVDLWADKLINPALLITEAIKTSIAAQKGKLTKLTKHVRLQKLSILKTVELDFSKPGLPDTLAGVPAEGNSPIAMGDRKGENRDSPPSFRAIGFADAQDTDRKPLTLYSAGMAVTLADLLNDLVRLSGEPVLLMIEGAQHALTTLHGVNTMFSLKSARDQINISHKTPDLMLVLTGSNRDKLAQLVIKKDQPFFGSEVTAFPLLGRDYTDFFTDKVNHSLVASNHFSKDSMWEAFQLIGHRPEILRQIVGRAAINHEAHSFSDLLKQDASIRCDQIWREFRNDFNALSPLHRAILTLLIEQGRMWSPFSEESMRYYKQAIQESTLAVSSVQTAIQALREKGFIWQSSRGAYALEDESFAEWVNYEHHKALESTLSEWNSDEDDQAFND